MGRLLTPGAIVLVKPLPDFLLSHAFWETHLCHDPSLHAGATGLLLSYAWLVAYRSDFDIATQALLLPPGFDYAAWARFTADLLGNIDLETLAGVSRRYRYGELRLSRLNSLTRYLVFSSAFAWTPHGVASGYVKTSMRYKSFFEENFGWLVAVFAYLSVLLSALQLAMSTEGLASSRAFQNLSLGIAAASTAAVFGSVAIILLLWSVLFWYYLLSTLVFVRSRKAGRGGPRESSW